jgi:hypothetical protein
VEEWLFLNGIALRARHVAPGDIQLASRVEADLADTRLAFEDRTAVPACVAPNPPLVQTLPEDAFTGVLGQDVG